MQQRTSQVVHLDRLFYEVLDVKQGGFGRVWLLKRPEGLETGPIYGQYRAVKTFDFVDNDDIVVNELCNWIELHHPAIVPLIKISHLNFRVAALMKLYKGTLGDILSKRQLSWPETRLVLLETALALEYAFNRHKLTHLDLKPANLLVESVNPIRVCVSDWGISRLVTDRGGFNAFVSDPKRWLAAHESRTRFGMGTPLYMAPERFSGSWKIDPSADIFSIGMIGIQSLTGNLPFTFDPADVDGPIRQLIACRYYELAERSLKAYPKGIANLLLTCINPDPKRRLGMHHELVQILKKTG